MFSVTLKEIPETPTETLIRTTRATTPHGMEWLQFNKFFGRIGFKLDQKTANWEAEIKTPQGENSTTLWCVHVDTVGMPPAEPIRHNKDWEATKVLKSDGTTILGADDKSGLAVFLHLFRNQVPGKYVAFWGEEKGRLGSETYKSHYYDELAFFQRAIQFDRRGRDSIITRQGGGQCVSKGFAQSLIAAYKDAGMTFKEDPGGTFTDTASFMRIIPECTNISVGYENGHGNTEKQDLAFLEEIAAASLKIDWEALPAERDPKVSNYSGWDRDYSKKHSSQYSHSYSTYGKEYTEAELAMFMPSEMLDGNAEDESEVGTWDGIKLLKIMSQPIPWKAMMDFVKDEPEIAGEILHLYMNGHNRDVEDKWSAVRRKFHARN